MEIRDTISADIANRFRVEVGTDGGSKGTLKRAVMYTPKQIRDIVGPRLSVRINFVPQMLTALAMELATEYINHCRDHAVPGTLKQNRMMRMAVETYADRLFAEYGKEATASYMRYVKMFAEEIRADVVKLRLKLSELVANQFPEIEDREVPILTCAICGVISYIEWYDGEMDAVLERKLGQSVRCSSNRHLDVVKAICVVTAERLGCQITVDGQVSDWLNILGNRAVLLAERIMEEEANENKS